MTFHYFIRYFPLLLLCACLPSPHATTPTPGPAHAIGAYTNGCLKGAVSLPPDGPGYQFMRITRRRFYGHPTLTHFIMALGEKTAAKGSVLLIGDMAEPRGGPLAGGHNSHQTGLDVDIWYTHPPFAVTRSLTLNERENLPAPSLVNPDGKNINTLLWTKEVAGNLQRAAESKEVERIFVNPVIKKTLCEEHKGEAWLHKIRPWWGHQEHFHVRLECPAADTTCLAQKTPIPQGDGCDKTLDWWFTEEASKAPVLKKSSKPAPPFMCITLNSTHE